jgi:phospholipase C
MMASPASITAGQSATLSWNSTNATSITIDQGIGAKPLSGSLQVTPNATITYHATAQGAGGQATAAATVTVNGIPGVPALGHVVIVLEENHGYTEVIGSASMPYLNQLAANGAVATQYYANTHPSIGNYFELTTGQIITNDDSFNQSIDVDDIPRELMTAGKTWKSYAESLPSVGYLGGDVYPYLRHHNPFTYFSDVMNTWPEQASLVPFDQFSQDLAANQLPNLSFIVPNALDDAHDGTLQQADAWLQANIAPLVADPTFQQDGLLIIVFDESEITDTAHGGGRVAMVMVGPKVKAGFESTTFFQHQSTLRLILEALGAKQFPGDAASAPDMVEFFK